MPKLSRLIRVTQTHIDNGKRNDCSSCPIALAILDELGIPTVEVGTINAQFYFCGYKYRIFLPNDACLFIQEFDCGLLVLPFEFALESEEEEYE